jgi:hypothetical protein
MTPKAQRILDWMREHGQPVLYSELRYELGIQILDPAHDWLRREGYIEAVYPERKPGICTGRQFWQVAGGC